MAQPIAFVSHFTVVAGKLDDLTKLAHDIAAALEADKPRTPIYLVYLDREGRKATFVHVFGDAAAMDLHFEGAQERTSVAMEFMKPDGWEIYGQPSEAALDAIRTAASSAGVPLLFQPEFLAGFSRLG